MTSLGGSKFGEKLVINKWKVMNFKKSTIIWENKKQSKKGFVIIAYYIVQWWCSQHHIPTLSTIMIGKLGEKGWRECTSS